MSRDHRCPSAALNLMKQRRRALVMIVLSNCIGNDDIGIQVYVHRPAISRMRFSRTSSTK